MADAAAYRASEYTIVAGERDKVRLDTQSEQLRTTTEELLVRAGLKPGDNCLDVGSGTGHTAGLMARVVGSAGRVTGIDASAESVELARREAAAQGLENVEFLTTDLFEFDGGNYDFVHCRFVLSHLGDPTAALRRIVSYLRPGGVVAVEDLDISGAFCAPYDEDFRRVADVYAAVVARAGGDPHLAQRLPLVAADAGLGDVTWRYHQPVVRDGPAKHIAASLLTNMRAAITGHGVADDAEVSRLIARANAFADEPDTLISFPRLAQVWGRRQ